MCSAARCHWITVLPAATSHWASGRWRIIGSSSAAAPLAHSLARSSQAHPPAGGPPSSLQPSSASLCNSPSAMGMPSCCSCCGPQQAVPPLAFRSIHLCSLRRQISLPSLFALSPSPSLRNNPHYRLYGSPIICSSIPISLGAFSPTPCEFLCLSSRILSHHPRLDHSSPRFFDFV